MSLNVNNRSLPLNRRGKKYNPNPILIFFITVSLGTATGCEGQGNPALFYAGVWKEDKPNTQVLQQGMALYRPYTSPFTKLFSAARSYSLSLK